MGNISIIAYVDKHAQMTMNKFIFPILFIVSALYLCWFYNYFEILFWQPQGIHFMRQTDCLSFISYYSKTGAPLWEPGLLCLYSHEGKTASEFPIVYYLLSFVWSYAGKQEFLLRLFNLTIFFAGVYHLLRMYRLHFQRWPLAIAATVCVVSSPVIVYYANNFLPDISAMGITLIALHYSYRYFTEHKSIDLIYAMSWYTCASLLKISYFIYPMAFFATSILLGIIKVKSVRHLISIGVYFAISLLLAGGWAYYVIAYNKQYNGYFLSSAKPYWTLDDELLNSVWQHLTGYWFGWHYPAVTMCLFGLLLVVIIIFHKQIELKWKLWFSMSLAGCIAFFVLFFAQLRDHDYYIMTFIPALAILTMLSTEAINAHFNNMRMIRLSVFIIISVIGTIAMLKSQNFVRWRYWDCSINDPYARVGIKLLHAEQEMTGAGISPEARLVFVPDDGYSGCTYFTNRFGWQLGGNYENELSRIETFKEQGASHLVIIDTALFNHKGLISYTDSLVLKTNDYIVYTLK